MSPAKSNSVNKQKNNTVSEAVVCRLVYDRHNVLETQLLNVVVEKSDKKLTDEDLKEIQKHLHAVITKHTDGLVASISNQFK